MFGRVVGGGCIVMVAALASAAVLRVSPKSTDPVAGPLATGKPADAFAFRGFLDGPTVASSGQIAPQRTTLPPLDLSDMRLWNWAGKWHASDWSTSYSPIPYRYGHISQPAGRDTYLRLDASGSPQLQAQGGIPGLTKGAWETEVTLPQLRDGLIVAPLWLYDQTSKNEIDFELAGRKGLDLTMHTYPNGVHKTHTVRLFAGQDMSGRRMRFGIRMNQAAGFVGMYVDGKLVHLWDRRKMNSFVSRPMKPLIEMWGADPKNAGFVLWAGRWTNLRPGERIVMTVHGYSGRPI